MFPTRGAKNVGEPEHRISVYHAVEFSRCTDGCFFRRNDDVNRIIVNSSYGMAWLFTVVSIGCICCEIPFCLCEAIVQCNVQLVTARKI